MKRLVVISDTHCGHVAGLTPPAWQFQAERNEKYARIQHVMWKWYKETLESLKPIDLLVLNGDAVDGKGTKSGGTELITSDRNEQINMAIECISIAEAEKVMMTYGTGYHTGIDEDWEDVAAGKIGAEIHSQPSIDVEGVIFDFKHKISSSVIPHGRHTGPARDKLWNILWAEKKLRPKADVLIRSHVHYFTQASDTFGTVFTTPCLQGPGSKFGARSCSGIIDIGLLSFDCDAGRYELYRNLMDLGFMAEKAIKI